MGKAKFLELDSDPGIFTLMGGGGPCTLIIFFQILPESANAPFAHSCKNFKHRSIALVQASTNYKRLKVTVESCRLPVETPENTYFIES